MVKGLKTREFRDKNYKAVFCDGNTLRLTVDPKKPILELDYPEFYDIKITDFCEGMCKYCYQSSSKKGKHVKNLVKKFNNFFGNMTPNQRPFQVAIGGGEPTSHPEFIELLEASTKLGIMPNYTTNGSWIDRKGSNDILTATKQFCGGVAVTTHRHLEKWWVYALMGYFSDRNIKTNLHILVSDKASLDYFDFIFETFKKDIKYFVVIPLVNQGRCKDSTADCKEILKHLPVSDQIAFSAHFYPYLKDSKFKNISLYEPEIMSKYLDMLDMKIYKSSFY
jgi:organic radical activating enzyme